MKTFLVVGAGTAGTMIAMKMAKKLNSREWKVVLVDKDTKHYYQPGFLFIPFGKYEEKDVVKVNKQFIPSNIEYIISNIELIEPDSNQVRISLDNRTDQVRLPRHRHWLRYPPGRNRGIKRYWLAKKYLRFLYL